MSSRSLPSYSNQSMNWLLTETELASHQDPKSASPSSVIPRTALAAALSKCAVPLRPMTHPSLHAALDSGYWDNSSSVRYCMYQSTTALPPLSSPRYGRNCGLSIMLTSGRLPAMTFRRMLL